MFERATAAGTLVAGVVLPEVASVEVATVSGRRVTAATEDDIGYAGAYRGHVRFFRVPFADRDHALWVRLIDAAGRTLRTVPGPDVPLARAPVAVARAAGSRSAPARRGPCAARGRASR